ncbi:unnamed protein product [Nezara viridula]|uniref:Uncharacterized protein n=1 Tax=Nezara viridula TaxID=85310 RepID=A0A9P0EAX5_NEZVI|nr:unnamed protein product [Nezara viridula]
MEAALPSIVIPIHPPDILGGFTILGLSGRVASLLCHILEGLPRFRRPLGLFVFGCSNSWRESVADVGSPQGHLLIALLLHLI